MEPVLKKTLISALALTTALSAPAVAETLTRVDTVPLGGGITGMVLAGGDLLFNVQHPADDLGNDFAHAAVGVMANADFGASELAVPEADDNKIVKTTLGAYQVLMQEGDFGRIGKIVGAGGEIKQSNDPDFNAFVRTGAGEGYLFTTWEDRSGGMSRVKLARAEDGTWSVNENDAVMLDFSGVHGTWVNLFGTLSPWNTPLTSDELYFDETAD